MGELKALSNGLIVALIDNGNLGDAGDVLTRVGASDVEFKPPSGGGGAAWGDITGTLADQTDLQAALGAVTFDQDLNTDDDARFLSVGVGTAPLAATGDIRIGNVGTWSMRNAANNADIPVLRAGSNGDNTIVLGHGGVLFLEIVSGEGMTLTTDDATVSMGTGLGFIVDALAIYLTSAAELALTAVTDLTINGTPGVTEQIIFPGVGTLDLTKGLATGWTPV